MKINQTGRSMVEMLGVLAIIGVLSVGGIAGYSKAMNKYKMNKQVQQINQIVSYLNYNRPFINTKPRQSIVPLLKKLDIIPKEMIKTNDEKYIYDVFSNRIGISDGIYGSWGNNKIITGLTFSADVLKDTTAKEACANLLNLFKEYHQDIWYIELVSSNNGSTTKIFASLYGDKYCSGSNCLAKIDVKKNFDFCSKAVERSNKNENFGYNIWWLDD